MAKKKSYGNGEETCTPKETKQLFLSGDKKTVKVTGQRVKFPMPSGAVQNSDSFYRL